MGEVALCFISPIEGKMPTRSSGKASRRQTIDRRFCRRKYNAGQVLATFSAALRDQVELDKLTSELLNVVEERMQSEQVSLRLRADKKSERPR
jgi:hypothetical protein